MSSCNFSIPHIRHKFFKYVPSKNLCRTSIWDPRGRCVVPTQNIQKPWVQSLCNFLQHAIPPFKGKWLEQVAILKHLFFSSLSFYSGRWKSASVRFAGTSTNNVGHLHPGGIGSAREMAKFRDYGLGGGWVCGVGLEALGTSASIFSNRVSFRRSPFPTQSSCSHRQSRWHDTRVGKKHRRWHSQRPYLNPTTVCINGLPVAGLPG